MEIEIKEVFDLIELLSLKEDSLVDYDYDYGLNEKGNLSFNNQNGEHILKYKEDGTLYSEPKTQEKIIESLKIPINRLAETDGDFQLIFEREFVKSKLRDKNIFAEIQIKEIEERLKRAKDLQFYLKENELIGKAIEYKRFLEDIPSNNEMLYVKLFPEYLINEN